MDATQIRKLPTNTNISFMYRGEQRKGPIEAQRATVVTVLTDKGYRSFHPNKMMNVQVLS